VSGAGAAAPRPARGRFADRLASFALLWLGLVGVDPASWLVGLPAAAASAWVSHRLRPAAAGRWRPLAALAFAGYFGKESLRGGIDVARRALDPRLPLRPGEVHFAPRLPAGSARLFFAACVSLLPGTLVIAIAEDRLRVHALDVTGPVEADLATLEARVAALFGVSLGPAAGRP
jgi:multicomponent Na+:H+ antiporter subunit E